MTAERLWRVIRAVETRLARERVTERNNTCCFATRLVGVIDGTRGLHAHGGHTATSRSIIIVLISIDTIETELSSTRNAIV